MSDRETRFLGFAKLLCEELDELSADESIGSDAFGEIIHTHLARRAYDFAIHVLANTSPNLLDVGSAAEAMPSLPDMTAWPTQEEIEQAQQEVDTILHQRAKRSTRRTRKNAKRGGV